MSAAADALPAAPAGWRLGGSALRITGAAGGSGQPVSVLPTGRDLAAAGGSAGGLALFCIDSIGQGAQWIRPPAQTSDPAGRLTFTPREDGICAVFGRMPLAEPGDYAVAGGRFFRTGSDGGFSVLDGLGGPRAAFWSVYAALGGEAALGRPLSRRFEADGQLVQVFERGVIVTDSRTSATARVGAPAPPIPAGAREPEPAPLPSRPA